jgi:hypothetical protein
LEDDRGIKRKGLEDLKALFKELDQNTLLVEVFQNHIFKNLVRVLEDKVEKHRDIALSFLEKYISFKKKTLSFQPEVINNLIRMLLQRVNSQPALEVSEELRLRIVVLLELLVKEFSEEFLNQIPDFTNMLANVL